MLLNLVLEFTVLVILEYDSTAPDRASPMQRRQRQRRYNSSNRCGGHRLRLSDGFYEKV